jgi:predicted nucleic acid-binding protein
VDKILLDTSVASLLHPRKKQSALREQYAGVIAGKLAAISFQTVAEMWQWAEYQNWNEREREGLREFLSRFTMIRFDRKICMHWARIMAASMRQGRRFEVGDCWVAATAIQRGVPLLAHDSDFLGRESMGLQLVTFLEPA